jgi:hypothetical protein
MTVRAVASGKGRVRTGRVGAQGPGGGGGVSPAFQTNFTAISSLPAGVSFSRASADATMFDSTGNLTYAPNNLITNSNAPSTWIQDGGAGTVTTGVSDPDGGTTASTFTSSGANARLYNNVGSVANAYNVINSIWIRRRTGTGIITYWDPNNTPRDITSSVTSTWARVNSKSLSGTNIYNMVILATAGDAVDIYHAQTEYVTYETSPRTYNPTTSSAYYGPRFDYAWNGSAWVAVGLMDEEQRRNEVTYSVDLSNAAWPRINLASVTAVTGIDGTSSAFKLVPDATNGIHRVASNTFGSTSSPFMAWAIVTASGYNQVALRESAVTGASAVFSLASGGSVSGTRDFGAITTSNAAIVSLGSGRFLISCLFTPSSAVTPNIGIYVLDGGWASGDPNSYAFAGNGTSGIVVECPQAEIGGFRTSYIPTTSAAVTRSADVVTVPFNAPTAGTMIIEWLHSPDVDGTNPVISANTNNPGWTVGAAEILPSGSRIGHTPITSAPNRGANAWDASSYSSAFNGVLSQSSITPTQGAVTSVAFGYSTTSAFGQPNTRIRSVALYTSRLSDADLQTKSVVGAAF